MLSENLPLLDHLDLSGTNFPGTGFPDIEDISEDGNASSEQSALPGWPSDRKLSFLGLWRCSSDACLRERLPAHRVAGDANEEQLLAALEAYADRWFATREILRSLCHEVSAANITYHSAGRCLELVIERMERYTRDKLVLICGSQLLYSLICHLHVENISPLRVRTLVQILVDILERNPKDYTIVCSCCLTLCQVCTYRHLLFLIERLLKVLLKISKDPPEKSGIQFLEEQLILEEQFEDQFEEQFEDQFGEQFNAQLSALKLTQVIIGQLSIPEKLIFGDVGGMSVALSILYQRFGENADHDDEIVDICWWLISTATTRDDHNCKLFVDRGGLELFVRCMNKWPDHKKKLYRTMLSLVTHFANVKLLRGYLKNDQLLSIFVKMLDIVSESNDISYYTAGVLSNMLADGEDLWHLNAGCDGTPLPLVALAYSRAAIGERIISAIEKWNPITDFNIAYCPLRSILSLIRSSDLFAPKYWAAWALNNLSLVESAKYCPLLFRQGALELLDTAIADARSPHKLRHWLMRSADRIREHIKTQGSAVLSEGSSQQQVDTDTETETNE